MKTTENNITCDICNKSIGVANGELSDNFTELISGDYVCEDCLNDENERAFDNAMDYYGRDSRKEV